MKASIWSRDIDVHTQDAHADMNGLLTFPLKSYNNRFSLAPVPGSTGQLASNYHGYSGRYHCGYKYGVDYKMDYRQKTCRSDIYLQADIKEHFNLLQRILRYSDLIFLSNNDKN